MEKRTIPSSYDGLNISLLVIRPEKDPVAVMQISHGICGRKERFIPFMQHMAANGVACIINDHRGHGESIRSNDDLGYMYEGGYKALVSDMRDVTELAHKMFPGRPVFLLGHSMGSLAARIYIKENDADIYGLILCGTPFRNRFTGLGRKLFETVVRFGGGRIRPEIFQKLTSAGYNRNFRKEGHQVWTCSDPQVRQSVAADPLCNYYCTANASYNLLCMLDEAYSEKGWKTVNKKMEIFLLSGGDDPCTKNGSSLEITEGIFRNAGYTYIRSKIYPGMRHEILNEKEKMLVWNDIKDFIVNHPSFYHVP